MAVFMPGCEHFESVSQECAVGSCVCLACVCVCWSAGAESVNISDYSIAGAT